MANFDDLALQYVVLDDEAAMRDIAGQAAKAIEEAGASRIAVGNWAQSIKLWMSPGLLNKQSDQTDDTARDSANAITRSKAIDFLATTLEIVNKDLLRPDQVELLVGFFGSLFSNDHKAGITPATKALTQLVDAKNFQPHMGVKTVEDVSKIKEDFRLQIAATRLEVYQLLQHLLEDANIADELQHKYGATSGFMVDLLSMCQHERDPKNLLVWFKIISVLSSLYSPSDEVVDEIFKTFSNYFPITLRESTTPIGITPDDLKRALRECFSAHQRLARLTFPYLIQRLDQGDSMKVTVKNDILMTMKACIEKYENPHVSLTPYITSIWNSLKYEVRNGEVAENVESATAVLRAIAARFQEYPQQLQDYVQLVFGDCLDDLGEQNYVKPAGKLCLAVIGSSPQAFVSYSPKLVDAVVRQIPQFHSATYVSYTRDLVHILQSILEARQSLAERHPENQGLLAAESASHFQNLFHKVYLPLWQNHIAWAEDHELNILDEITAGVAMLVKQYVVQPDGKKTIMCSPEVCKEICSLLIHRLLMPLTLSPRDVASMTADVDIGLPEALATIVAHYMSGFDMLLSATTDAIAERDWKSPKKGHLDHLWRAVSAVSFIGCSQLPDEVALAASTKKYSTLQHFMAWTGALLELTETLMAKRSDTRVVRHMVAGLHHAMATFQDACGFAAKQLNLLTNDESALDWTREFKKVSAGAEIPNEWLRVLKARYPDIYGQVWPRTEDIHAISSDSREDIYGRFIRLSLFIIRHLCRRITKEVQVSDDGAALHLADEVMAYPEKQRTRILVQIERMAPMVIKVLDAPTQRFYNLGFEAFQLFSDSKLVPPFWSVEEAEAGALNLLTLSILKGLWPDAMTDIYQPNGIAQAVLCDHSPVANPAIAQSQSWIIAFLVNRFKESTSTLKFEDVVKFWIARLEPTLSPEKELNDLDVERVLAILVGGVPRQEKAVIPLFKLIHKVIGMPKKSSRDLAHRLDAVFAENDYLNVDNHAVVKPLFKQWAYAHLVKPMLVPATTIVDTEVKHDWYELNTTAELYAFTVLSILRRCAFAVYEADIEILTTMCLTSLNRWIRDLGHVEGALHVLLQIMRNEPKSLRYTVRAIIAALKHVYEEKVRPRSYEFEEDPTDWQQKFVENLGGGAESLTEEQLLEKRSKPYEEDDGYLYHTSAEIEEERQKRTEREEQQRYLDRSSQHVGAGDMGRRTRKEERFLNAEAAVCRKMVIEIVGEMPRVFEDRYLMPYKGDMILFLDACCGDPVRELRRAAVEAKEGWFGR